MSFTSFCPFGPPLEGDLHFVPFGSRFARFLPVSTDFHSAGLAVLLWFRQAKLVYLHYPPREGKELQGFPAIGNRRNIRNYIFIKI